MIHHVALEVADLARSAAFYDAVLAKLGWRRGIEAEGVIGWGIKDPVFFVTAGRPAPSFGSVAFSASGIAAVKAAFEAGQRAGGTAGDEPFHRDPPTGEAYSASLRDPDGYEVEFAVTSH